MTTHPNGNVLVVCTGNICRSPYLERLLAQELRDTDIVVSSAGTGALVDQPMHPESALRVRAAGADPSDFVARQLTPEMVQSADLVVAATREHVGGVIQLWPRAMRYAFSLPDLSDLLDGIPLNEIHSAPGATHVARVAAAAIDRRGHKHPRQGDDSGIVDPYMQAPQVFDQMVAQIDAVLRPVVAALRGGRG